jgi:hypothetical protein
MCGLKSLSSFLLVFSLWLNGTSLASTVDYSITVIDFPGAHVTMPTDINDFGDVVGSYYPTGTPENPYPGPRLYKSTGGTYQTITIPGSDPFRTPTAYGINNASSIVGGYTPAGSMSGERGYILTGGSLTTIDIGPAASINNAGQVVGSYSDGSRPFGYHWNAGVVTTINVPGSVFTAATGINDAGHVTGIYSTNLIGGNYRGFVWSNGTFLSLNFNVPGANMTFAMDINNSGDITGDYSPATGGRGFVYRNGVYTTLEPPGAHPGLIFPSGINNLGQVVGNYSGEDTIHGFLASPVVAGSSTPPIPEPSTILLVSSGLVGIGLSQRRRNATRLETPASL